MVKTHLVPQRGVVTFTICGTKTREGGKQAVQTLAQFKALAAEERCLKCEATLRQMGRL